jgi:hypothetical protein
MTTSFVEQIAALQNRQRYQDLHWEGSFDQYIEMVRKDPRIARTAFLMGEPSTSTPKRRSFTIASSTTPSTTAKMRFLDSTSR